MTSISENVNNHGDYPVSTNDLHCIPNDEPVSARTPFASVIPKSSPARWDTVPPPLCDKPYRSQLVTIPVPTCKDPTTPIGQDPILTNFNSSDAQQMRVDVPARRQRKPSFLDTIFLCHYRIIGRTLGFFLGCMQVICTLPEIVHVGKSCHVLSRENAIFVLFTAFITVVLGLAFGLLPDLLFKLSLLLICLYQMTDSIAILVSQPCDNMAILTGVRLIFNSICIIGLSFVWKRL